MCSPSRCFLHTFLFTNIHNLSISLPHSLALSPMYLSSPLSSATFTVTLQTCEPSSSLYLAHSLALISHPHSLYSLLFWMQPLCLSLSLSVFLPHVNSHFSNMYTIPLSLSRVLAFLSLQPCSPPLFPLSLSSFLYISPIISLSLSLYLSLSLTLSLFSHAHPFDYLLLRTPPLCLSHTPPFSLQPHTHTLLSSVADMACLCLSSATLTVTLQTRTLPPYPSLPPSPQKSLNGFSL